MLPANLEEPCAGGLRPGSRTQGLLATLLGDYWYGRTTYIPSAALVALLAEFEVSSQAARAALSRLGRSGVLEGTKHGRHTSYRMAPAAARRTRASGRAIMQFTQVTPETSPPWDGRWTIAVYSLPSERMEERRRIRQCLRVLGFAPVQDAVWVSPKRIATRATAALDSLVPAHCFTVFESASAAAGSPIDPAALWPLDEVAGRYRAILVQLRPAAEQVRRGGISPSRALVLRTEAMNAWRVMPRLDPALPIELLPDAWPGWEARRRFADVYDGLGESAEHRVRELVGRCSQEAADAVHHDTVSRPRDA